MEKKDKTIVVTMRCIDMVYPTANIDKVKCNKCGEMTWISQSFRGKNIDEIICEKCFFEYGNNEDFCAVITEACIDEAINCIENIYGEKYTREEMLRTMEDKIGKKIIIKNI